jgi:hypothetical protein
LRPGEQGCEARRLLVTRRAADQVLRHAGERRGRIRPCSDRLHVLIQKLEAHVTAHAGREFVPHNAGQVAFHDQMRKLWEDHITWTRLAIVCAVDELPDTALTVNRLLRNQDDIGAAIVPFYGQAAGDHLAALLHEHINTAVELVLAAKSGDTAGFDDAKARWYANGNEIADFLAAANPRFWPRDVMRDAMKMHLDHTLAEAAHRIAGDHAAEIADYEQVHAHILKMADLLSAGIMQQFPSRFDGEAH